MKYLDLVNTLQAAGKATHTIVLKDGTRVLLLPHGGRVLGLFSADIDDNFYWTHPALQSRDDALAFYASGQWENSGGDRTWLAPEVDLFFPRFPDLDMSGYLQPRQLDPGSYTIQNDNSPVRMVNVANLESFRSKEKITVKLSKWIEPTLNPLRYERDLGLEELVQFSGYQQHTSLEVLNGMAGPVGLWNLIQMPRGGEMIIPTYGHSEPKVYFSEVPVEHLEVTSRSIQWRMCAGGEQKIGVRAIQTTGRVGYLYGAEEDGRLVVRNFSINPAGEYVDTPWTELENFGYAVQACNVNSWLGQFSELEYHVPAIGKGTGSTSCEDISQVWAFRGTRSALDRVADMLLGCHSILYTSSF